MTSNLKAVKCGCMLQKANNIKIIIQNEKGNIMKWTFIDPALVDKKIFGLNEIFACKVAKWHYKYDVRGFYLKGWETHADLVEFDPITNKKLNVSQWYIFAAKGV